MEGRGAYQVISVLVVCSCAGIVQCLDGMQLNNLENLSKSLDHAAKSLAALEVLIETVCNSTFSFETNNSSTPNSNASISSTDIPLSVPSTVSQTISYSINKPTPLLTTLQTSDQTMSSPATIGPSITPSRINFLTNELSTTLTFPTQKADMQLNTISPPVSETLSPVTASVLIPSLYDTQQIATTPVYVSHTNSLGLPVDITTIMASSFNTRTPDTTLMTTTLSTTNASTISERTVSLLPASLHVSYLTAFTVQPSTTLTTTAASLQTIDGLVTSTTKVVRTTAHEIINTLTSTTLLTTEQLEISPIPTSISGLRTTSHFTDQTISDLITRNDLHGSYQINATEIPRTESIPQSKSTDVARTTALSSILKTTISVAPTNLHGHISIEPTAVYSSEQQSTSISPKFIPHTPLQAISSSLSDNALLTSDYPFLHSLSFESSTQRLVTADEIVILPTITHSQNPLEPAAMLHTSETVYIQTNVSQIVEQPTSSPISHYIHQSSTSNQLKPSSLSITSTLHGMIHMSTVIASTGLSHVEQPNTTINSLTTRNSLMASGITQEPDTILATNILYTSQEAATPVIEPTTSDKFELDTQSLTQYQSAMQHPASHSGSSAEQSVHAQPQISYTSQLPIIEHSPSSDSSTTNSLVTITPQIDVPHTTQLPMPTQITDSNIPLEIGTTPVLTHTTYATQNPLQGNTPTLGSSTKVLQTRDRLASQVLESVSSSADNNTFYMKMTVDVPITTPNTVELLSTPTVESISNQASSGMSTPALRSDSINISTVLSTSRSALGSLVQNTQPVSITPIQSETEAILQTTSTATTTTTTTESVLQTTTSTTTTPTTTESVLQTATSTTITPTTTESVLQTTTSTITTPTAESVLQTTTSTTTTPTIIESVLQTTSSTTTTPTTTEPVLQTTTSTSTAPTTLNDNIPYEKEGANLNGHYQLTLRPQAGERLTTESLIAELEEDTQAELQEEGEEQQQQQQYSEVQNEKEQISRRGIKRRDVSFLGWRPFRYGSEYNTDIETSNSQKKESEYKQRNQKEGYRGSEYIQRNQKEGYRSEHKQRHKRQLTFTFTTDAFVASNTTSTSTQNSSDQTADNNWWNKVNESVYSIDELVNRVKNESRDCHCAIHLSEVSSSLDNLVLMGYKNPQLVMEGGHEEIIQIKERISYVKTDAEDVSEGLKKYLRVERMKYQNVAVIALFLGGFAVAIMMCALIAKWKPWRKIKTLNISDEKKGNRRSRGHVYLDDDSLGMSTGSFTSYSEGLPEQDSNSIDAVNIPLSVMRRSAV